MLSSYSASLRSCSTAEMLWRRRRVRHRRRIREFERDEVAHFLDVTVPIFLDVVWEMLVPNVANTPKFVEIGPVPNSDGEKVSDGVTELIHGGETRSFGEDGSCVYTVDGDVGSGFIAEIQTLPFVYYGLVGWRDAPQKAMEIPVVWVEEALIKHFGDVTDIGHFVLMSYHEDVEEKIQVLWFFSK